MKKNTYNIKKEINKFDSCEERIDYIKDKYKGKTAVIILPGPSLNDHNHNKMREIFSNRDDLVIMPCKGSYDTSLETSDFHIMNPWNIDKKNPIKYNNGNNTISFWNVTAAFQDNHLNMISTNGHSCDIWVPCFTEPYITKKDCIHNTCNFEQFWLLGREYKTIWGTPILYSTAIPLALHIGCRDFIIMGWDTHMFHRHKDKKTHFKETKTDVSKQPWIEEEEVKIIESSYKLYDWCEKNKIKMRLLTDVSPIDDRFQRIENIEGI